MATRWAGDVSPEKVHPEYPRPQMVRPEWKSLNGLWEYAITRDGAPAPSSYPGEILVPFPVESALSGVMKRVDERSRLWYRRRFDVPRDWAGRRVLLHFGAVDWEAVVSVNGRELGSHRGGYDGFSFDITDALRASGPQELLVAVRDPSDAGTQPRGKQVHKPGGIYYTPTTGIWQTVWLEPVPKTSIEAVNIAADVDRGEVRVRVALRGPDQDCGVLVSLPRGGAAGSSGEEATIRLSDPHLWSPGDPYLYDLDVRLTKRGRSVDAVKTYFGIRKIALGKDDHGVTRLLLNGKPLFQIGLLDQGFWPDGLYTAPTDEALRYDIETAKRLGFNLARKHVKVEPERWYYWCDRLGLLVWQDMPSGDRGVAPGRGEISRSPESARQFERELKAMIDGRRNHPSIIQWVVFNEGWGQFDTGRLAKWVKDYDPTRLVDEASGWNDLQGGDVHDVHAYPGPEAPDPEPGRAAVLGEFGGLGLGVDGHTWAAKTWGYQGTRSHEDLTRKYVKLLRGVWRLKEERGLSAAVYTQITDVETEANGLMTYDRAVVKVDADRVAAANRGVFPPGPEVREVVASSRDRPALWRYTLEKPAGDWFRPGFDDSGWKKGPGGFGTRGTPGAVVRTTWKTADIWLRREFQLPDAPWQNLHLLVHHDEDADVYVNGVLAAALPGYVTDYEEVPLGAAARAALKVGKNVFAVHCKQTTGGQYIDVGLVDLREPAAKKP